MSHPPYRVLGQLGLAALSLAVLAACSGKEHAATPNPPEAHIEENKTAPEPSPANSPAQPVATPAPVTHAAPRMKHRASHEAPLACDLITAGEVGLLLEKKDVELFDHTEKRRQNGTWTDSACLFAYGKDKDPDKIGLDSEFVRIDVYTDASLQEADWGPLNEQWQYRTGRQFDGSGLQLHPHAFAAWVDSDHPPDPALLVRQGDVMFEISYYPPAPHAAQRKPAAVWKALRARCSTDSTRSTSGRLTDKALAPDHCGCKTGAAQVFETRVHHLRIATQQRQIARSWRQGLQGALHPAVQSAAARRSLARQTGGEFQPVRVLRQGGKLVLPGQLGPTPCAADQMHWR